MNRLRALLFTVFAAGALSQVATPPSPQSDPFVGTWQINLDKSKPKLKTSQSAITVIVRENDELVFSAGEDKTSGGGHRIRCDGRFHSAPSHSTQSCKYNAPNSIDGEWRPATFFEGKPNDGENGASYWRREVSANGQEMKFLAFRDRQRTNITQIVVLDRVK